MCEFNYNYNYKPIQICVNLIYNYNYKPIQICVNLIIITIISHYKYV